MLLCDIPAAVARATGEDLCTISRLGFNAANRSERIDESDQQCCWLDCPFCGHAVLLSAEGPDALPEAAECERCDAVFDYSSDEVYAGDPLEVLEGDACKWTQEAA